MNKETIQQVDRFLEEFEVEAHALCTQTVTFNPGLGRFRLGGTDVYGSTTLVGVRSLSTNDLILEIPHDNEEELVIELSELYHELLHNEEAFTEHVQKKYEFDNNI